MTNKIEPIYYTLRDIHGTLAWVPVYADPRPRVPKPKPRPPSWRDLPYDIQVLLCKERDAQLRYTTDRKLIKEIREYAKHQR